VVAAMNDEQFVYAFIGEYLDGELAEADRKRMVGLLESPKYANLEKRFKNARGRMQLAMQSYYLKDQEMNALKALVEDPSIRATHEAEKINQLERKEFSGNLRRRIILIASLVAIVAGLVWLLREPPRKKFEPLQNLGYEALAMDGDPAGRLDLPTDDIGEISGYLKKYPGLTFEPQILGNLGDGWVPKGASMIDYEEAKVALVYYAKGDESLFHFSYAGSLSELPKADAGNRGGFIYQTYASNQLNMIAWQHTPDVVSMIAGYRDAQTLADIAKHGLGK
jgi:hypothetical protein